jgi:hypothetical protein
VITRVVHAIKGGGLTLCGIPYALADTKRVVTDVPTAVTCPHCLALMKHYVDAALSK